LNGALRSITSFFDTNRKPDHDHNHVDTREELVEYDPDLAALVSGEFRNTAWRYVRPSDRGCPGHLAGYDPKQAPRFAWSEDLVRKYDEYQAEREAAKN